MLRFVRSTLLTTCHCFTRFSLRSVRSWWGSAVWWRSPSLSPWRRYWSVCASLSTSLWSSSPRTSYSTSRWRNGPSVTASSPFTRKVTAFVWCRTSLSFLILPKFYFIFGIVSVTKYHHYLVCSSSDGPMRCSLIIIISMKLKHKR